MSNEERLAGVLLAQAEREENEAAECREAAKRASYDAAPLALEEARRCDAITADLREAARTVREQREEIERLTLQLETMRQADPRRMDA